MENTSRRDFLRATGMMALWGLIPSPFMMGSCSGRNKTEMEKSLKISLAQWSLHRALQSGKLDHLDFPHKAKTDFGIHAVEYVNAFFMDKAKDNAYLAEMNTRCDDLGISQLLIMIDGEGGLAVTDEKQRLQAVENHFKWVEAAKYLGCHSIRVNAYGEGDADDLKAAAINSLGRLAEFAKDFKINVIVENHGGQSSNGQWLKGVISAVNMTNCGTLPDFGNFCLQKENEQCVSEYDRYQGVKELMPFAKAVSAKSYDFDSNGNETTIDFGRMIGLVKEAGYHGYIGIEYEGNRLSEEEGIRATKGLLERLI